MREHRIRSIGNLWQLADETGLPYRTFTLIPATWSYSMDELLEEDPTRIIATVRTDINRALARLRKRKRYVPGRRGFMAAFMHGDFNRSSEKFQLHLHGVAAGELLRAINELRKTAKYKCHDNTGDDPHAARPVRIAKAPLKNMPAPLSYVNKAYWTRSATVMKDGKPIRVKEGGRVPEPYHTANLLWLDRWTVGQLGLRMNIVISRNGMSLRDHGVQPSPTPTPPP